MSVCVRERVCASSRVCVCVYERESVCHQSTARAIREQTSPNAFSRRTCISYITLACHVTV